MASWMQSFLIGYAFLVGSVVGSFLNVVIYRVPRRRSVVTPRSACPSCAATIRWYDNIPMLSWALLGGRCRGCRAPISIRYPAVEALGALVAALAVGRYGLTVAGLEMALFGWVSLALAFIDIEHQILPDVMTYPSIALGLAGAWLGGLTTRFESVLGALFGAALPTVVILVYRWLRGEEGMGWGDVKYLAAIGAVVGIRDCVWVLLVAALSGALVGVALWVAGRGTGKTALPFGTFLAGAVLVWMALPEAWQMLVRGLATPH